MVEIKVYVKHFCQVYNVDYGGGGGTGWHIGNFKKINVINFEQCHKL